MRRFLVRALAAIALLGLLGVTGIGWYYSGEILVVPQPEPPVYGTEVLAAGGDDVSLRATDEAMQPGIWGLKFPGGYARVGDVVAVEDDAVARPLEPVDGEPQPGERVDVDGYAYPSDPDAADFGFEVEEARVAGPLGEQPAWYVEGDERHWAIFVHGRGGGRHECFRMLPVVVEAGMSALCVSYRNDQGTPADPDGIYRQGDDEWLDVEAAVAHARRQGAQSVVLVGYSMGGQITANFLRRSELSGLVDALIWDSPLLDWGPVIARGAQDRGVPGWLVPIGMRASELRAGVDYDELNQVANADEFTLPTLLFHGDADGTVPVSVSDRFAAARPDLVTYERVAGAEHVGAWNTDRERYESAVAEFLATHVPP